MSKFFNTVSLGVGVGGSGYVSIVSTSNRTGKVVLRVSVADSASAYHGASEEITVYVGYGSDSANQVVVTGSAQLKLNSSGEYFALLLDETGYPVSNTFFNNAIISIDKSSTANATIYANEASGANNNGIEVKSSTLDGSIPFRIVSEVSSGTVDVHIITDVLITMLTMEYKCRLIHIT